MQLKDVPKNYLGLKETEKHGKYNEWSGLDLAIKEIIGMDSCKISRRWTRYECLLYCSNNSKFKIVSKYF